MRSFMRELFRPRPMTNAETGVMSVGYFVIGGLFILGAVLSRNELIWRLVPGAIGLITIAGGVLMLRFWPRRGPR